MRLASRFSHAILAACPKDREGERKPADVIGNAVRVMQITTGETQDNPLETGKEYARKGGLKGGRRRAAKLPARQRSEIACVAVDEWEASQRNKS